MKTLFEKLPNIEEDPIFAIQQRAVLGGGNAINASIGTILDEEGNLMMLPSVHHALKYAGEKLSERGMGYAPLLGLQAFKNSVIHLLFGADKDNNIACAATTGGTGALALNLRLINRCLPGCRIIVPVPAWQNYRTIIEGTGLQTVEVPYLVEGEASIDGCLQALETSREPSVIIVQACCHNPTGKDWTIEQWDKLLDAVSARDGVLMIDVAYQGLGSGVEEDVHILKRVMNAGCNACIAWSGAKNHTLYGERPGLAATICRDEHLRSLVERHYGRILRSMHSCSPLFGQWIVSIVQEQKSVEWMEDLLHVRSMLERKRSMLQDHLPQSFRPSVAGKGLFAMLPLGPKHVEELWQKHGIFLGPGGRINIAGIPMQRILSMAATITSLL